MNKNIFCIWSGSNEMSNNRKNCLQSIIDNSGCDVIIINPENLHQFDIKSSPIHPAYNFLSLTHKSDYLRAYLMHHYGFGYTDIKHINFNWQQYFDLLENSDAMFIGYAEQRPNDIASSEENIKQAYKSLCGCGHFIFKPKTEFTSMWLNQVHDILDSKLSTLKEHPGHYHPRAIYGGAFQTNLFKESKYPLGWNEILGKIIHKLMYNFQGKYLNSMPYPNLHNYR